LPQGALDLAYTTVLTVLDRLARKGRVARRKVGRSFVYMPVLSRDVLRRLAVQELLERYFDGSEDALRQYLSNGNGVAVALNDSVDQDALDTTLL